MVRFKLQPQGVAIDSFAATNPRRSGSARSFAAGLLASSVLHLLAFQITFSIDISDEQASARPRINSNPGHPVLQLLQIKSGEERVQVVPGALTRPQITIPAIDVGATIVVPIVAASELPRADTVTVPLRDRLRSTIPFAPATEHRMIEVEPTLDVARERVTRDLHFFNDSIARAEEAIRKSRDWTRINESGERWGISGARLNLGKYTVPLQYDTTEDVFRPPLQRREENQRRIILFREIEWHARRAEIDAQIRASLREIRARTDAKRDSIRERGGAS